MFDMQKVVDAMNETSLAIIGFDRAGRETRSQYHLTLGGLIEALERSVMIHPESFVRLDSGGSIGEERSYRGYYTDLAFDKQSDIRKCSDVLEQLNNAVGKEYFGYKGGHFEMETKTPLWVSGYGEVSGIALIGTVTDNVGNVIITTKETDPY